MILFFFALPKLIWWSTYNWLGGDFLCKTVHFLFNFAFCFCSNMVALIGVLRWMVSKHIASGHFESKHFSSFIAIGYILAFLVSLPQFHIWRTVYPFDPFPNWAQCVTKWGIIRWKTGELENFFDESIYTVFHYFFLFWIPFFITVASYLGVFIQLKQTVKRVDRQVQSINRQFFEGNEEVINVSAYVSTEVTFSSALRRSERKFVIKRKISKKRVCRSMSADTLIRARRRFLKTTAYVISAYVCCWSSYNVLPLLQYLNVVNDSSDWRLLYNLIILNAVVNPCIYGL